MHREEGTSCLCSGHWLRAPILYFLISVQVFLWSLRIMCFWRSSLLMTFMMLSNHKFTLCSTPKFLPSTSSIASFGACGLLEAFCSLQCAALWPSPGHLPHQGHSTGSGHTVCTVMGRAGLSDTHKEKSGSAALRVFFPSLLCFPWRGYQDFWSSVLSPLYHNFLSSP